MSRSHSEVTPSSVRREIEQQFDLERKVLDDDEYKKPLKKVTRETAVRDPLALFGTYSLEVQEEDDDEEEDEDEEEAARSPTSKPTSKPKSTSEPKSDTNKSRGKKRKSEEAALFTDEEEEQEAKPRSKSARKQFKSRVRLGTTSISHRADDTIAGYHRRLR